MAFQTTVTTSASLDTPLAVAVQSTFPIVIVARLLTVFFVTFQTTITLVASLVTPLAIAVQSITKVIYWNNQILNWLETARLWKATGLAAGNVSVGTSPRYPLWLCISLFERYCYSKKYLEIMLLRHKILYERMIQYNFLKHP